eukprot:6317108-Amphidinium_carterae.2
MESQSNGQPQSLRDAGVASLSIIQTNIALAFTPGSTAAQDSCLEIRHSGAEAQPAASASFIHTHTHRSSSNAMIGTQPHARRYGRACVLGA